METNTGYPNRTQAPETEQNPDSLKTEAKQEAEYLPTKKAGTHIQTQKMLFYYLLSGVVWWAIYIIGRVEKAYITTAQGILNVHSVSPSRPHALLEKKILAKKPIFLAPCRVYK
jgi:hypothetical protein